MLAAAPMRRIRSPCGAGAASGHPVVEPPSTDMNSRRRISAPKLRRQYCIGSNE